MRLGLGLGVNKGRKSGFTQDAAITALLDQASTDGNTAFSGSTLVAANTLVTDLKSAGIWDKLDLFYVFATNGDEAFARYNWKDPSTFQATENGAGALTFTSNEGFKGDGVNSLDTNYNPTTDNINFQLNTASISFYSRNIIGTGWMFGDGAFQNTFRLGNNAVKGINRDAFLAANYDARGVGFYHSNRKNAAEVDLIKNGVVDTRSQNSLAATNANIFVLARGAATNQTTSQVSIFSIGGDLSAEATDFYSAVQTYMTEIGKQV